MSDKLNRFSARITEPRSQGASQAMLYGTGLTAEDMGKAQVGISSVWWEGNTCNMHLNDLAARIKGLAANGRKWGVSGERSGDGCPGGTGIFLCDSIPVHGGVGGLVGGPTPAWKIRRWADRRRSRGVRMQAAQKL